MTCVYLEQDCAAEDERDEGDQLAEEDERIEHERGEAVADELEDQGGVESESAEDERNLEQGFCSLKSSTSIF